MLETNGKFYLGRIFDPIAGAVGDDMLLYDPDDLTTHAVVVGMTGSGKTGLCLDLLEEAGLRNLPAIMIDPKGDITNALLHFPELRPLDFEPWINVDEARREGKSTQEVAAATAELWRNGLANWHIEPERIQALADGPRFAIYTPGSDAGLQVSILASLAAPAVPWDSNKEVLREQISGTVTALLGLTGMSDIDPVQSREHILLSNIFENAWSQGQDLDLGSLIMQVQAPPFEKLGFFDVNTFFPEKDRFALAMALNSIVAAPSFQAWVEGAPLDIERMLYDENGRVRHTIFYIAHLPESERMFFVTLLYSAIETWMRSQRGTTSLRALVYFDEIFGYLPAVGNPPSKEPMLRMLKQARAFGVGLVLATQNPVDVDYKALSNAGTWFVGKLGTEQDKARLLDGLTSAAGAGLERGEYDRLISALGKRVFLLRNVHEKAPVLFSTRWAMNYLAGPMTRTQIPALNALAGVDAADMAVPQSASTPASAASPATATAVSGVDLPGTPTRPAVPSRIGEYFLPANLTLSEAAAGDGRGQPLPADATQQGLLYRPVLLAQAEILFNNRKYNLDYTLVKTAVVVEPDARGVLRWEEFLTEPVDSRTLDRAPLPEARFATLDAPLADSRGMSTLQSDFVDWLYRNAQAAVRANETLKVYAGPQVDADAFEKMCVDAAEDLQEAEVDKLEATYKKKIDSVQTKLEREERELREDQAEVDSRKQEEMTNYAETVFSLFRGRRRSVSSAMTKRRLRAQAEADVQESVEQIAAYTQELEGLRAELQQALNDVEEKWADVVEAVTEIGVSPYKKDIVVTLFGVAWMPSYLLLAEDRLLELPAFASES